MFKNIKGSVGRHQAIPRLTALRLKTLASKSPELRADALCQLAEMGHRIVAVKALELAKDKEIHKVDRAAAQVFYSLGNLQHELRKLDGDIVTIIYKFY